LFGLAPLIVEILRRFNRELGVAMLIVGQNAALALDREEYAGIVDEDIKATPACNRLSMLQATPEGFLSPFSALVSAWTDVARPRCGAPP
jgi:hypothetical protein